MITFNPQKFKFSEPEDYFVASHIFIKNFWGKKICSIYKTSSGIVIKGANRDCKFNGNFEYLKIYRREDKNMGTLTIQLFCKECGDAVYKLSAKLPSLIRIETDFDVTKDTN